MVMDAHLIVLPYRTCTGTSGIVHLVANFGRPIIATRLPEFEELLHEGCGLILTCLSPEGVADTILRVYADKSLWNTLARKNIAFSKERAWSNIAKQHLELYIECLSRHT